MFTSLLAVLQFIQFNFNNMSPFMLDGPSIIIFVLRCPDYNEFCSVHGLMRETRRIDRKLEYCLNFIV